MANESWRTDMKLTMETDYAIRILYCLAKEGKKLDAKTISDQMGVTLRFSLKILRKLVQSGLVRSYKGVNGGYELGLSPAEISLADIITAVEGSIEISKCLSTQQTCTRVGDPRCCQFRREFARINRRIVDEFAAVKLEIFLKEKEQ